MENKTLNNIKSNIKWFIFSILISLIFLGIMLIKGYQSSRGLIYVSTIFLTTFMTSRILGSFFYKDKPEIDLDYTPNVTFVVPCKNEEKAIYHTIQKCFEIEYPEDKIEVIMINDGSTDNTWQEMTRAKKDFHNLDLKIVNWKKNQGKRFGMKYGYENAKGEIIIQLDSDSYPDAKTFRHIIMPFKDKKISGVVGHSLPSNGDDNFLTRAQYAYYFMSFRVLKASESLFDLCFCLSGCYAAYRKKDVVPLMNELCHETFIGNKCTYGDDRSLTSYLLRDGHKTVYASEAVGYTICPNTWKIFLKQQNRWKKSFFIDAVKISKFIIKKDKFVAFTYFFPLVIFTFLTPIIAFLSLIIIPLFYHTTPVFYIIGILLISTLTYTHYRAYSTEKKYGKYMFVWMIMNMTILSYLMFYSMYDLFYKRNFGWSTR